MALTPEKQRALEDIRAHVSGSEAIEAPVKANIFFSRSVDTAALRQPVDRLVASSGLASVHGGKSLLGARTEPHTMVLVSAVVLAVASATPRTPIDLGPEAPASGRIGPSNSSSVFIPEGESKRPAGGTEGGFSPGLAASGARRFDGS